MKHNLHSSCALLILLLFITSSYTSARFLAAKQGEEVKPMDDTREESLEKMDSTDSTDSFNKLMGLDICENGDEECLTRRLISEAHLDYIYTQHHKP